MSGNKMSYDSINAHLKIHDILNVSKKTLVATKNILESKYIKQLNDDIINHIYPTDEPRIIAVDGTHITLLKSLTKDGFKVGPNGDCCTALVSTLFDVQREIPINYHLFKNTDERAALIEQLQYLKKDDILIMDRGYFSMKLLDRLTQLNVNVVFRLKKNLNILKWLKKTNSKMINIRCQPRPIKFRLVKYKVGKEVYYIGTTLYEESITYIKALYWTRWRIETSFRYSKYNLSLKAPKSKNDNGIKQDILIHQFIYLISSFFQYLLQKDITTNHKISTTSHLNVIVNEFLHLLVYKYATTKIITNMVRILNISKQIVIPIRKNRHYDRIRITPTSKWCKYGNKYKMTYT
jgi:hypothetical protein